MRFFLATAVFFSVLCSNAQDVSSVVSKRIYAPTVGKTAYYFWSENENGLIDSCKVFQPYCANTTNYFCPQYPELRPMSTPEMMDWMEKVLTDPRWDKNNRYFFFRRKHRKDWKVIRHMHAVCPTYTNSVLVVKKNGQWETRTARSVIYFTVAADSSMKCVKNADSLLIPEWEVKLPSNGHYRIVRFQRPLLPDSICIFNGGGQDISTFIRSRTANTPERFLLLINGYRGPQTDDDPGDGVLTVKDRYYYWFKIDNRFQEIVKPDGMYYLDGSFPMATSVHRNRFRFLTSWTRTKLTPKHKAKPRVYRKLNTEDNAPGFEERRKAGRLAGEAFLIARNQQPGVEEVKDTVDIVSHSMGFAYALGFMDVVASHVYLRNNYIIAPENAAQGHFDWSKTARLWQYGSDLGMPDADPLREQDGIAPQAAVNGIESLPPDKGGRIFVPKDWPNKNFVDVHMIYSYDWIFDRIPKGYPGYVGNY